MLMFLAFYFYYLYTQAPITPNLYLLTMPLLLIISLTLASGVGLIITSLTTKYRDLAVLTSFGVQLWFYITPIVYPSTAIPSNLYSLFMLNPMAPLVEAFRYSFFGIGIFDLKYILISAVTSIIILLTGLATFTRSEKNFADTL